MKQTVISMLLAGIVSLPAIAQSAFEEINTNPALSAGKYYAYQAPEAKLTPVPEGYTPFYISTFARHGSRYLTKKKKYDSPLSILKEAARQHKLTTDGQRALNIIEKLAEEAAGRYGELTPKGAQQHKDLIRRMYTNYPQVFTDGTHALNIIEKLAEEAAGRYGELTPKGAQQHKDLIRRMYTNYPQVFTDGTHVDARSTYKTRAFLSMAAACVELKGLNPRLVITTDASEHDAYYIKYKNPTYEEAHLANADSVYQAADSVYIHPERLMKQLFINADIVKDPRQLMADLFELHGISQSSYHQEDLSFLFTSQERYDLWQRNNFEWYYEKGASPLSGSCHKNVTTSGRETTSNGIMRKELLH